MEGADPPRVTMPRLPAHTATALLYLVPILAVGGMWAVRLSEAGSSGTTAWRTFVFVLTDGPVPGWFRWMLVLPVLCLALGAAHLSRAGRSRGGSVLLFVLGSALSVAAWLTAAPAIALFVSLPLVCAFVAAREHHRTAVPGA